MTDVVFRTATPADAPALYALIGAHQREGHLLPRGLDELTRHAPRFVVCQVAGALKACAELAPLSASVAEVRSLVVADDCRRAGIATRLVNEVRERARAAGFNTLCAFTHDTRLFARHDFSVVPHAWIPEKVETDCRACPLFGRCGQSAMVLPLRIEAQPAAAAVDQHAAVA